MRTTIRAGALAALVLSSQTVNQNALAGPSDYIFTPIVEEGEREIDVKAGSAKDRDGSRASGYSLGL